MMNTISVMFIDKFSNAQHKCAAWNMMEFIVLPNHPSQQGKWCFKQVTIFIIIFKLCVSCLNILKISI